MSFNERGAFARGDILTRAIEVAARFAEWLTPKGAEEVATELREHRRWREMGDV